MAIKWNFLSNHTDIKVLYFLFLLLCQFTMVLQILEISVDTAENGRKAVDMFIESNPGYYNAILMDIRMPEMDGLEATSLIRDLERPNAKTIPIIALTANAFDEDVQRSMQAGMNAHLTKPIDKNSLFTTLENLI